MHGIRQCKAILFVLRVRFCSTCKNNNKIFVQTLPHLNGDSSVGIVSLKPGQYVKSGDVLAIVETDKVSMEITAEKSGYVNAVFTNPSDIMSTDDPICAISDEILTPSSAASSDCVKWIEEYHSLVILLYGAVQKVTLIDLEKFDKLCTRYTTDTGVPQSHVIWNYAQACYLKAQYTAALKLLGQLSSQSNLVAEIGLTRLHIFFGNINFAMRKYIAAKLHYQDALQAASSDVCLAYYGLAVAEQAIGSRNETVRENYQLALNNAQNIPPGILTRIMLQYHFFAQKKHFSVDSCMSPFVAEIYGPVAAQSSYVPRSSIDRSSAANQTLQVRHFPRTLKKISNSSEFSSFFLHLRRSQLHSSQKIVFLTGSGISKAAGLLTRQDLWKKFSRQDAVSAAGVAANPDYMWDVIRDMYSAALVQADNYFDRVVPPTLAHMAINNLARMMPVSGIITQNVDNLHQEASRRSYVMTSVAPRVLELHGSMNRLICNKCGRAHPYDRTALNVVREKSNPKCNCDKNGMYIPDVVFFGERVDSAVFAECVDIIKDAAAVIVAGTALDVAPAATLLAATRGIVIDFNRDEPRSGLVDYWVQGDAQITLPHFVHEVIESSYHWK